MLIDGWLPLFHASLHEAVVTTAPPDRVHAAVRDVTIADLAFLARLVALRRWLARAGLAAGPAVETNRRVLDELIRQGFIVLEDAPRRELVLGTARPQPRSPREFRERVLAHDACLALSIHIDRDEPLAAVRLSCEVRLFVPDPDEARLVAGRRALVTAVGRRLVMSWLRAVRRRAESTRGLAAA